MKSNETAHVKFIVKKNVCVVNNNWVPLPMFGVPTRAPLELLVLFCCNSLFYFPIFPHITLILLLLEYVGFKGKTVKTLTETKRLFFYV